MLGNVLASASLDSSFWTGQFPQRLHFGSSAWRPGLGAGLLRAERGESSGGTGCLSPQLLPCTWSGDPLFSDWCWCPPCRVTAGGGPLPYSLQRVHVQSALGSRGSRGPAVDRGESRSDPLVWALGSQFPRARAAPRSGAFQDTRVRAGLVLSSCLCWFSSPQAGHHWSSALRSQTLAVVSASFLPVIGDRYTFKKSFCFEFCGALGPSEIMKSYV